MNNTHIFKIRHLKRKEQKNGISKTKQKEKNLVQNSLQQPDQNSLQQPEYIERKLMVMSYKHTYLKRHYNMQEWFELEISHLLKVKF